MPQTMVWQARVDCADISEVNPAAEDEIYIAKLNKYVLLTFARDEKRVTEVTATASGYTFTSGLKAVTGTPTNWFEIVEAFRVTAAGSVYGTPLEVCKVSDVLRLQSSDSTPGTPRRIAFVRRATSVAANVGKYDAYVHPIPDATTYVGLLVRSWPDLLTDPNAIADLTALEQYTISKLAAAEVAYIFGEPERAEWILRSLPDETLAHYGIPRVGYKPAPEPAMAAA